ncbi:MAG: hypothetical protein WC867_04380 [Candidatus Pacearchaeota archaeon]|jgi:hypothetical protein
MEKKEVTRWVLIILSLLIICVLSFYIWKIFFCCTYTTVGPTPPISQCINVNMNLNKADISNSNVINVSLFFQQEDKKISHIKVIALNFNGMVLCNSDYAFESINKKSYNLSFSINCPPNSFIIGESYIVKVAPKLEDIGQCDPMGKGLTVVAGE